MSRAEDEQRYRDVLANGIEHSGDVERAYDLADRLIRILWSAGFNIVRRDPAELTARSVLGLDDAVEAIDTENRIDLFWWRELFHRIVMHEYPLLPWPELPQDHAFVAFTIDGLMQRLGERT